MYAIAKKEINAFFSSPIAYFVVGFFLLTLGLILWVFPAYSLLEYKYATLGPLFELAPIVFAFLIPAICMRLFAEEQQLGTLEFLLTKPISIWKIIGGKYLAAIILLLVTLLPTLVYYYSIYEMGSPKGNLDGGGVFGSYIGLFLLGACFSAISLFSSSLSSNQIIAFLLGLFLCFIFYWAFYFISSIPSFVGKADDYIQKIGIDYHYHSISRGVIEIRDIIYFLSVIFFFLYLTWLTIQAKK